MRKYHILIQALITLFAVSSLNGQVDPETDLFDTIVVVKDLKLTIQEREPYILRQAENEQPETNQSYQQVSDLEEVDISYQDPPLSINPIRYTQRLEKQGNDGLIKVGYGTPRAIDAKLLYTYHIEDWYQVGVKAGYSAANNETVNDMNYKEWHTGIMGGYWLRPNLKVSIDTDFKRNNQGLYGHSYGEKPILGNRTLQSIQNRIGINLSKYESIGLQLDAILGYDAGQMIDLVDQQNHLFANAHLAKTIWNDISLEVTANVQSLSAWDAENLSSFSVNPSLRYLQEDLAIEAGVYYVQYEGSPILWPKVKASYAFSEQPISLQVFSTLDTEFTSLINVISENPFVSIDDGTLAVGLTRQRIAGVNGTYTHTKFKATPYYQFNIQNDVATYQREDITFAMQLEDEIQSHTLGLRGEYAPHSTVSIGLNGYYNIYSDNIESNVSYLPLYGVELSANQQFVKDRLMLSQSIHFGERTEGGSPISSVTNQAFDSQILDLSASVNFKVFPNFWVYAEGNNLLLQDYEIWQGYAVFQPKAVFGIKYLIGQN